MQSRDQSNPRETARSWPFFGRPADRRVGRRPSAGRRFVPGLDSLGQESDRECRVKRLGDGRSLERATAGRSYFFFEPL
jgi:hypothetical protein